MDSQSAISDTETKKFIAKYGMGFLDGIRLNDILIKLQVDPAYFARMRSEPERADMALDFLQEAFRCIYATAKRTKSPAHAAQAEKLRNDLKELRSRVNSELKRIEGFRNSGAKISPSMAKISDDVYNSMNDLFDEFFELRENVGMGQRYDREYIPEGKMSKL